MNSVDTFAHMEGQFDRLAKSLDLAMILEQVRRLEPMAFARHFKGYRLQTLGRRRILDALKFEVFERKNEAIGDLLTLLWNQEHRDVYGAMLENVKKIKENVEEIEAIEDARAAEIIADMTPRFPAEDVLICVRLNEVRFSEPMIGTILGGPAPTPAPAPEAAAADEVAQEAEVTPADKTP